MAQESDSRVITKVIKFANGMVIVFDQFGEQMPEYQGRYEEVMERLLADAPDNSTFAIGDYRAGTAQEVARSEF